MVTNNLFVKLKFKKSQLDAIVEIYNKHFKDEMPEKYEGKGIIGLWYDGAQWETGKGADTNHKHMGIVSKTCQDDPLWQEFADLLPHMGKSATITKITPNSVMLPHVDRKWRPEAIYFPISGCTEACISEYYELPKINTQNSQSIKYFPKSIASYSVTDNAVLTNVHEWHSVRNKSDQVRVAFGWNFISPNLSYKECYSILNDLGYID
jgi:hypothetical protein